VKDWPHPLDRELRLERGCAVITAVLVFVSAAATVWSVMGLVRGWFA